jgi:hypothetical protein
LANNVKSHANTLTVRRALAVQDILIMLHNFIGSLISTAGVLLYDVLFHSAQAMDWYRYIFVLCFIFIVSNYFGFNKNKAVA